MAEVDISGSKVYCEVSIPGKPRPLVPTEMRSLILNLLHHQDHPGEKETVRRVAE